MTRVARHCIGLGPKVQNPGVYEGRQMCESPPSHPDFAELYELQTLMSARRIADINQTLKSKTGGAHHEHSATLFGQLSWFRQIRRQPTLS